MNLNPQALAKSIIARLQKNPEYQPMFIDELLALSKEKLSPTGEEVILLAQEVIDETHEVI